MDAMLLALVSAALFGAMTVALRFALAQGAGAEAGALLTIATAFVVTLPFALAAGIDLGGLFPFALAGLLGPGLSQVLFTLAVRDAGPSRTSVAVGTAPLFSVAIALVFLDEPLVAGLIVGAILIVAGGLLLVGERGRPEHVRTVGIVFALVATVVFASRDNLVRWLAVDTDVAAAPAASATLAAGLLVVLGWTAIARVRISFRTGMRRLAVAGLCFGLSYLALFEAYYRGRVTVVSPLVATESLWGVGLSALLLRAELVGVRLLAGAALVVAGGALIGVSR
ncbi:MAG: DMT family transporter [Actinomycetota bacterium]|nr:DMT family transporter [Actinomycetota bacterium]